MLIKGSIENNYVGCGEINASDRIVNGNKAKHNSIPWQVALVLKGKETPFCGGTIICSKFIMTAAHCIDKNHDSMKFMMPGEFQIVTIDSNRRIDSTHESWHNVNNISVHPKYWSAGPKFDYDYAIIELVEPIKLTGDSKARAACLPDQKTDINFPSGTEFVVSGWGTLKYKGRQLTKLHHVAVQSISDAKCITKLEYKTEGMHCAVDLKNYLDLKNLIGACNGDSGGRVQKILLYYYRFISLFSYFLLQIVGSVTWVDPGTKKAKLIGVVISGLECASFGHPAVYAEVAFVMDWVNWKTGFCGSPTPPDEDFDWEYFENYY